MGSRYSSGNRKTVATRREPGVGRYTSHSSFEGQGAGIWPGILSDFSKLEKCNAGFSKASWPSALADFRQSGDECRHLRAVRRAQARPVAVGLPDNRDTRHLSSRRRTGPLFGNSPQF